MNVNIIIILLVIFLFYIMKKKEDYTADFNKKCDFCENGYNLINEECLKCKNYGLCEDNIGNTYCVKGNSAGPSFNDNCTKWTYGHPDNKSSCVYNKNNSMHDCGYYYPRQTIPHLMSKFSSMSPQLGTNYL